MSCAEAWENCQLVRGIFAEILYDNVDLRDVDPQVMPIVPLTDCKSLYDNLQKEGAPKAPSEKRLALDLAAIRQMIAAEPRESSDAAWPVWWIPTTMMAADGLTKVMTCQVLSDGTLWFLAARKVCDTPFPFAYSQLNALVCFVHLGLFPLLVADKVASLLLTTTNSYLLLLTTTHYY